MVEWLGPTSTVLVGLYAGALLTEGAVLVPYWRTLSAEKFYELHRDVGPRLFRYFAPLTAIAVGAAVLAAVLPDSVSTARWIAAGLCVAALLSFFVYFRRANAQFARHSLSEEDLTVELQRWAVWHHGRTLLVVAAFCVAVVGG